jgi:hypothetical protein
MRTKRELAHTFPMRPVLDCGDPDGPAQKALLSTKSRRLKMKPRFSLHNIRSAMTMLVAAVAVSGGLATGAPEGKDATGTAVSVQQTGSITLAQYNPCPNGKCR